MEPESQPIRTMSKPPPHPDFLDLRRYHRLIKDAYPRMTKEQRIRCGIQYYTKRQEANAFLWALQKTLMGLDG